MGDFRIPPRCLHELTFKVNVLFAPGEALREMVTTQKDFKIFSPDNTLTQAYRVLQIVPSDFRERRLWYRYLDYTKTLPSDLDGVSGHDRIIRARQENLESATALPMYTTVHSADQDPRVTVTRGRPILHDPQEHIIISVPVSVSDATTATGEAPAPRQTRPVRRKRAT